LSESSVTTKVKNHRRRKVPCPGWGGVKKAKKAGGKRGLRKKKHTGGVSTLTAWDDQDRASWKAKNKKKKKEESNSCSRKEIVKAGPPAGSLKDGV